MARSSLVVMGAFVASKLVGLLRDRAIAHQFGASAQTDAYVAAFVVPDLLFTVLAGGALISAFLPVFSSALANEGEDQAWLVASGVGNIIFLVTAVLAGAAALIAPQLVAFLTPSFPPDQQALTVDIMRVVLLSTVIFSISGLQMGILNALHHFLTPALAPIAYNLGILLGTVALAPRYGVMGVAYGVVLGALGHLFIKVPALLRHGYRWLPVLGLQIAAVRRVFWLLWPRTLALGTVQAVNVVNANLASALTAGSLSALRYAWNISQMPQAILGTAIGTVAFPTLALHAALGQRDDLRNTGVGALRVMIVLTVPAMVGLWVLAGPAIQLLLTTGAFGAEAAAATLATLQMYALGLLGHVTLEVVARMYYAQQDTLRPLLFAVVAMVINIGLALALVGPMAQAGLALANSVAVSVEVLLAIGLLSRRLGGFGGRSLLDALGRSGAASLVMAVAVLAVLAVVPAAAPTGPLSEPLVAGAIRVGLGGTIGLAVYAAAAWLLRIPEFHSVTDGLRRRLGR
jgi:putative peptidoglycan lipid II flippase